MRRNLTRILIYAAFANIIFAGAVLLTYGYTVIPLLMWLRTLQEDQLRLLISFAAKCELMLGLAILVVAAFVGRSLLPKQKV